MYNCLYNASNSQTNWNDETCNLKGNDISIQDNHGFFLMNHWNNNDYDLPSKPNAEDFNTYESLSERIGNCGERLPNIIAVDFWSTGDVLDFIQDQNAKISVGSNEDVVAAESRSGNIRH